MTRWSSFPEKERQQVLLVLLNHTFAAIDRAEHHATSNSPRATRLAATNLRRAQVRYAALGTLDPEHFWPSAEARIQALTLAIAARAHT